MASLRDQFAFYSDKIKRRSSVNWDNLNSVGNNLRSVRVENAEEVGTMWLSHQIAVHNLSELGEHLVFMEYEDKDSATDADNLLTILLNQEEFPSSYTSFIARHNDGRATLIANVDVQQMVELDQLIATSLTIDETTEDLDARWEDTLIELCRYFDVEDIIQFAKRSTPAWLTRLTIEYSKLLKGSEQDADVLSADVAGPLALKRINGDQKVNIMIPDSDTYLRTIFTGYPDLFELLREEYVEPVRDLSSRVVDLFNSEKPKVKTLRGILKHDLFKGPTALARFLVVRTLGIVASFGELTASARSARKKALASEIDEDYVHPDVNLSDPKKLRDFIYNTKFEIIMECDEVQGIITRFREHFRGCSDSEILNYRRSSLDPTYRTAREELFEILAEKHFQRTASAQYFVDRIEHELAEKIFDKRTEGLIEKAEKSGKGYIPEAANRIREQQKFQHGFWSELYGSRDDPKQSFADRYRSSDSVPRVI